MSIVGTKRDGSGALVVASRPAIPPPDTTEFVLSQDDADLEIRGNDSPDDTESAVVEDGVNLYLQTFLAGAAGDPSEKGSRVDVLWREGAGPTDHVVERLYVSGQTTTLQLSDVNKARDGTVLTGDGATTKLVIRRYRLSSSKQEVDVSVRGYLA